MTETQWQIFIAFKTELKQAVQKWTDQVPQLQQLQKEAAKDANTPDYSFEVPVVYNTALDSISKEDEIKLIVVGDNPGKDEQLLKNQKYLVGQAGKLGEKFFRDNPELGIDFRKNVIILNKTPVHSAKTAQLKYMVKQGGTPVADLLLETQLWMAQKTAQLAKDLNAQIWLIGYGELKPKAIFSAYRETLKTAGLQDLLLVFQHFSMNRFTIDLGSFKSANPDLTLSQSLQTLGKQHRFEFFGY